MENVSPFEDGAKFPYMPFWADHKTTRSPDHKM